MRIAYVTTDEVNSALAVRIARSHSADLTPSHPERSLPTRGFEAILCDLDCVPPDARQALLDGILSGRSAHTRAVHGYGLSEEQAAAIRLRGVVVSKRLHSDLVRTLCRAARRELATVPPDDALTDLTWINLVE
jgi:hypothetical protein